jgi:RNA polymerase sigma factor (sigma-70 family)
MNSQIDWASCEVLVKSLASKYLSDGTDLEDLQQEARIAILEAHHLYNSSMGVSLNTFLGRRIRDSLRAYTGKNSDTVELSRSWVAESISGGPSESLEAKTKEDCEALRQVHGAAKYRKPRRVIETGRATVSLDETRGDDGSDSISLHEQIGCGPEQELGVIAAEMSTKVTTKVARNGGELAEIFRMRNEGLTFEQIATALGKPRNTVWSAYTRAQKKIARAA